MTASDFIRAYQEGLAAADQVDAVNPYAPAAPGSKNQRLAQLWLRGRLKNAADVPGDA